MPSIRSIVNVTISRETAAVAQAGFGVVLIVGESAQSVFDDGEVVREYTSTADMVTDGFLPTDPEYLAATRLMGQKNKSQKFLIGAVTLGDSEKVLTYTGALTSGTPAVSVNGTVYSQAFLTDQATTMSALAVKIDAHPNVTSAAWDDTARTLTIASNSGDLNLVSTGLGNFTAATTSLAASTSTWGSELAAILEANPSWFALIPARYSYSDAIAAGDFVSANARIMGITIWDSSAVTNATSGLAYALDAASYDNVAVYYHDVFGEHLAASSFGERLPAPVGNGTFKFKTFSMTPVTRLSQSQITAARAKNVNLYLDYGGVAILTEGVMASGEFIDTIINTFWLQARMTENVFGRMLNNPKIPFSDVGFSIVESAIREVLAQAVRLGIILDDEGLVVNIPRRLEIPTNDRAGRRLPDVTFGANLAGAVHEVAIFGTISI